MKNIISEKEQLQGEIKELEAQIEPKQKRLNELYQQEEDTVKAKIKRAMALKDSFTLDELLFAAYNRCDCGAGLAYPEGIGMHGAWYCSDILLGRAIPANQPNSKPHIQELPFIFYEIKSENQTSAEGATTRPEK